MELIDQIQKNILIIRNGYNKGKRIAMLLEKNEEFLFESLRKIKEHKREQLKTNRNVDV